MSSRSVRFVLWVVVVAAAAYAAAAGDDAALAKAKQECAPQLAGLAACLGYVGGTAKTPTMDCCTGMKQVLAASKKCVCLLVKYKDDPSLGVKFDINRALSLPSICHSQAKLDQCPSLLHLPPNSPEAKMFDNLDKTSSKNASTPTPSASANATATPTSSDASCRGTAVLYGLIIVALGFLVC